MATPVKIARKMTVRVMGLRGGEPVVLSEGEGCVTRAASTKALRHELECAEEVNKAVNVDNGLLREEVAELKRKVAKAETVIKHQTDYDARGRMILRARRRIRSLEADKDVVMAGTLRNELSEAKKKITGLKKVEEDYVKE